MRRRRRGRHCSTLATLMRPQDQRSLTFLAWSPSFLRHLKWAILNLNPKKEILKWE